MGQMSESGKVSLPTPERIEPIKLAAFTREELIKLIRKQEAALEESQQQLESKDETIKLLMFNRNSWEEAEKKAQGELVEAQQTIARQQERERSIIYEVSEIHKEAAAGNSGSLDRADTALNRIMLLSSNLLALGNKEGSNKA
jgi:multidrug resistance efflux pump